jgi:O-antigen/teichoic acid export membrane protein
MHCALDHKSPEGVTRHRKFMSRTIESRGIEMAGTLADQGIGDHATHAPPVVVVVVQTEDSPSIDRVLESERELIESNFSVPALGPEAGQTCEPRINCDGGIQQASFPASSVRDTIPAKPAVSKKPDALARSSVYGLLIYVIGAGLTFLVQLLIARLLHAEGYGIYSYVWAWVSLLSYGATLGFVGFVLRFTSSYRASEQWSLMSGSIRFALKRSLAASLAISTIGLLTLWLRSDHLQPEFAVSMAIGLVTVPLVTLHLVGASIVRVFGGFIAAVIPERVFRDTLLLAILGIAAWSAVWPFNVEAVLAGSLVANAATLALVAYAAFRRWPEQIKRIKPDYLPQGWWAFAFPVMIMLGLDILIMRSGVLVLGWRGAIAEAGIFALGFNLAMLVQLSRAAVGIYFSPAASELHARGDFAGLQSLFARATMLSVVGGAILTVPVLLLTHPLLRLFGHDFDSAVRIVQILVIGQFIVAAAGPQQTLLTMTGHERSAAATMLVFTTLTFVGCGIATINHGAMGAAVATAVTLVAWNLTMAIQIERRLGMKPGLVLAVTDFWPPRSGVEVIPQEGDPDPTTLKLS